jgi:hypothetical protein
MSVIERQPRRNREAGLRLTVPSQWPGNFWVAVALAVFFAAWTLHTSVSNLDSALHHDVL